MRGQQGRAAGRAAAAPEASAEPLTRKLRRLTPLSPAEAAALAALQSDTRPVLRNREIITAGRKYDGLFVLLEGFAIRYRVLHDGRRQILNIVLPGDFIGFPTSFFEAALYSVTTLTNALVSDVSFASLFSLFRDQPRLAAAVFASFSCEAAMYVEHLTGIGRRSARERVAHFLLELLTRLEAIGEADACSFRIPLTQELIGDALGLSLPHVNRTLRQLREEGLVRVDGQSVVIEDRETLGAVADFEAGYLGAFRVDGFPAAEEPPAK